MIFAGGLAWASTVTVATSYTDIALQMLLLGGGLGLTTAPATEAIMGSLPRDKAGVGSAVNDTTREFGGTLGVAIVGSIFASFYSHAISSAQALSGLPGELRAAMGRSRAVAHSVINQVPAGQTGAIRDAVNDAFHDGLHIGTLVCAGIALSAAIIVAWLLPSRETVDDPADGKPEVRSATGEPRLDHDVIPAATRTALPKA